jgi:dTDP-4-dehydrorhamnose reductase
MIKHKILVLGASGMLGNAVLRYFAAHTEHDVVGSIRAEDARALLPSNVQDKVVSAGSIDDPDMLTRLIDRTQPTVVINCVGLVKQLENGSDPLSAIPINSILPHRLARLCALVGARLVHLSTDCVFSGTKGMYSESDIPDAYDVYGRTKLLGEVDYPHTITLRTSIIGHELRGSSSLIGSFFPGCRRSKSQG